MKASKRAPNLSDAQKLYFLEEHYAYEVRELEYTAWFFVTSLQHKVGVQKDVEQFLINSSLDHFLLHARNLLEFYYEGDKPHLYAHAYEFIPRWRPPKRTPAINKLRERVHPEVAHLGWARLKVTPAEKKWDLADVGVSILDTTLTFLDMLEAKYQSEKLRSLRTECQRTRDTLVARHGRAFPDMFKAMEAGGHRW